jgi:hypothetical protein
MLGPTYCLTAPPMLLAYSTHIQALEKRVAEILGVHVFFYNNLCQKDLRYGN